MDLADLADNQIETQLKAALHRHAHRNNGARSTLRCTECNCEIPAPRRELLPQVSICVDCAEALEASARMQKNTGTWWY